MNHQLALIVEDDQDVARISAEALAAAGFETEIVRDGAAALARLAVTRPALVLLDLNLPGVHGTEVLRQIRADARLAGVQVVVATGVSLARAELEDKADFILIKPVSYDQLHQLAARLIIKAATG
ncbi:MAG: response regulator [Anaerolineae bacterium]|nr:response regulator [Anaerolineae bacterium]